ncbi:MAG: PEP-CTERM sorting domain-containing protein, partial [Akkermansia sp.]
ILPQESSCQDTSVAKLTAQQIRGWVRKSIDLLMILFYDIGFIIRCQYSRSIPEPTTISLGIIGLGLLALRRRRA